MLLLVKIEYLCNVYSMYIRGLTADDFKADPLCCAQVCHTIETICIATRKTIKKNTELTS